MKNLMFVVLGAGILGAISLFALPLVEMGPMKMTLWDARKLDAGQVYLTLAGFAVPAIMGGLAVAQKGMVRWQGIVAAVFFALAAVKTREGMSAALGGKLMLISAVLGLVAAIATIAKPTAPANG